MAAHVDDYDCRERSKLTLLTAGCRGLESACQVSFQDSDARRRRAELPGSCIIICLSVGPHFLTKDCPPFPQSDSVALLIKFYNEARHAVRVGDPDPAAPVVSEPPTDIGASFLLNLPGLLLPPTVSSDELDRLPLLPSDEGSEVFGAFSFDAFMGPSKPAPVQTKDGSRKKASGGNRPGRCSICLEPISVKDGDVVVFFCWHAYHLSCLSESEKRGKGAPQESLERDPDDELSCVLCTTAAAVKKNARLLRTTTGSTDKSTSRSSVGWGQAIHV